MTRLTDLPQGAFVRIKLEVDGDVSVLFLDQTDLEVFPDGDSPLFKGSTTDRLGFGVKIPESGHYYVVVENDSASEERQLRITVTAGLEASVIRNSADEGQPGVREKLRALDEGFSRFNENLKRFFVFEDVQFRVARCGSGNAYSADDSVILCAELGPKLRAAFSEERDARNALVFALLHEISHVLLRQWEIPLHDNEEVVDELTTVILKMFGEGDRARAPAVFFSQQPAEPELRLKGTRDDRHPISVQRARNILRWLDDPGLVRNWQKLLVPHMQTELLEHLKRHPTGWTDILLVERELLLRSAQND